MMRKIGIVNEMTEDGLFRGTVSVRVGAAWRLRAADWLFPVSEDILHDLSVTAVAIVCWLSIIMHDKFVSAVVLGHSRNKYPPCADIHRQTVPLEYGRYLPQSSQ